MPKNIVEYVREFMNRRFERDRFMQEQLMITDAMDKALKETSKLAPRATSDSAQREG